MPKPLKLRRIVRSIIVVAMLVYASICILLFLGQSSLIYHPEPDIQETPDKAGLAYEAVIISSTNNVQLSGWFMPATGATGTVLFCHGNAGNISNRIEMLRIWSQIGFNVFIFDYRGFGQSTGRPSEQGLYDDVDSAWRYLTLQRNLSPEQIIVHGQSLGGAIAAYIAQRHKPRALVLESAFTSMPDLAAGLYPYLPARLMLVTRYPTAEYLRHVKCPVLVVHSRTDEMIPLHHGQSLFAIAPEPKQFLEITGTHNQGFITSGEIYENGLRHFALQSSSAPYPTATNSLIKYTAVARKYAPVIFQETVKGKERFDYITRVDYDGDLIGNNNWDNLESGFSLVATLYWSVLETETHYFISYAVYHPRDWSALNSGVFYESHENDMENIQVVVRKDTGASRDSIEILLTQAHLGSRIYVAPDSSISNKDRKIDGHFETVGDGGKLSADSTHIGIYVEPKGHGIYGIRDKKSNITIGNDGLMGFKDKSGVVYYPAKDESACKQPDPDTAAFYRLESTYEMFWAPFRNGELYGNGRLFDGSFAYKDDEFNYPMVPRHFDSDRLSGVGKKDAGISPFAVSFSLWGDDVGGLFFNPARHYPEALKILGPWSRKYIYHPY